MTMTAANELHNKLVRYDAFVNDNLRVDLQYVLTLRDTVYSQTADYLNLQRQITLLITNELKTFKTMVDMGCNFYVQAHVPDTRFVYVNVGFGFHTQFTLTEALAFIDQKVIHLERLSERYTQKASSIKANIRLVLETIRELLDLESPEDKQHRHRHNELMEM